MSIDWFRWYHGTVSDPKLALIARKAQQPRPVVVAIWAALLECASQANPRGDIAGFDAETLAVTLDIDESAIADVLDAMIAKGMITDNSLTAWSQRQVCRERDDDSKGRVAAYRQRNREQVTPSNATVTPSNALRERVEKKESREEERRGRKDRENKTTTPTPKTPFPPDFAITPELQAWAEQHGYRDLAAHLDSFRDKATAKGYQYTDWIAAFRNAVRDDWAGLRKQPAIATTQPDPPLSRLSKAGEQQRSNLEAWIRQDAAEEVTHELH